jgi:ABC-2 type transport system permease protein
MIKAMLPRQLRNELLKLFSMKRTYIGFGAFLVAQNTMLLAFHYSQWQQSTVRLLELNGYPAELYISALTVAVLMLIPQVALLMPLYTSLVGGDMVAKEYEDGTLRMILCRPVTRLRLLGVKWVAGLIFCVALVVALGVMALVFARFWFPWQGMFVFAPRPVPVFAVLPAWEGLQRYALAHVLMALNACTIFGLAFMFSCWNMKPAAATILALSFLLLNLVMENMPFFEDYKEFFLTYHFKCWLLVYPQPTDWPEILARVSVILAVNATAFVIGATTFQVRDIKN